MFCLRGYVHCTPGLCFLFTDLVWGQAALGKLSRWFFFGPKHRSKSQRSFFGKTADFSKRSGLFPFCLFII
uniref:Secreted protein n=1 Tax=Knipowitschia caucasica TaxID=637954 RepID=A0AAV2M4X1_KNICA